MITEKDQAILDDILRKLLGIELSMESLSSGGFDGLLKNVKFTFNAIAHSQEYGIPLTGNQFDYDLHGFRFRIVENTLVMDVPRGAYILSNDYDQDLYEEMLEEIFQTTPYKELNAVTAMITAFNDNEFSSSAENLKFVAKKFDFQPDNYKFTKE